MTWSDEELKRMGWKPDVIPNINKEEPPRIMAETNKKGMPVWALGIVFLATLAVFSSLVTYMFGTHSVTVTPGSEVVLIDQPYFFGHEGIRPQTLKSGRELIWDSTKSVEVAVTPQVISVNFDDISSKDNILLDFSTSVQYQVTDAALLLGKFGGDGWFDNNVRQPYSMIVRQNVKSQEMGHLMSDAATATSVDQIVTEQVRAVVAAAGLPVKILDVTLGRAKPNDNVLTQMNQTAAEQQRQKTLVAATTAEDQRAKSEEARAKADNAYRNAMQMNPEEFIRLQEAKLYSDACQHSEHCVITSGQSPTVFTK